MLDASDRLCVVSIQRQVESSTQSRNTLINPPSNLTHAIGILLIHNECKGISKRPRESRFFMGQTSRGPLAKLHHREQIAVDSARENKCCTTWQQGLTPETRPLSLPLAMG